MKLRAFARPPRLEPTQTPHRFGGSREDVVRVLRDLAIANRYFGGMRSVLHPLQRLLAAHRGGALRILDVGCGRADTLRALVRWARRRGLSVRGVGVDLDPDVANDAAAGRSFPEIRIVRGDALRLPFRPGSFDYVVSSMLLHYFSTEQAPGLLRAWGALAARALVINEVERHWFPCLAISVLGRVSRSSLFREGSRRTVLRGFTPEELAGFAARAGFGSVRINRYFPFRLTLIARTGQVAAPDPVPDP